MRGALLSAIRAVAGSVGLDVRRLDRRPEATMLGLARRDIRTVVDVGANRGDFVRSAAKLFPGARYFAFEPLTELTAPLEHVGTELGIDLRVIASAVGDTNGTVDLHRHEHLPSSSLLANGDGLASIYPFAAPSRTTRVPITTLDAALEHEAVAPELLVKLDVQGFEDRVLRGGARTMATAGACILEVILAGLYDRQATFDEVHDLLHASGLRFAGVLDQVSGEGGDVVYLDVVYVRPT